MGLVFHSRLWVLLFLLVHHLSDYLLFRSFLPFLYVHRWVRYYFVKVSSQLAFSLR